MAEIKIRKKRPVWIWIVLVLIVAAVIAYLIFISNGTEINDFS